LVEIHRFHAHEFESRPTTARLDPIKQSSFLSEGSRMSFTTFAARAVLLYLNYPHQPQSKEKSCGFAALLPQVSTPLFCFHHRLSLPLWWRLSTNQYNSCMSQRQKSFYHLARVMLPLHVWSCTRGLWSFDVPSALEVPWKQLLGARKSWLLFPALPL